MTIDELIAEIPEKPVQESLAAIESVVLHGEHKAVVRVHLAHEFRVNVELDRSGHRVRLSAPGWHETVDTDPDSFRSHLARLIYMIDEAIAEGRFVAPKVDPNAVYILPDDRPPAPPWMDIPVWDPERQRWYDAEY